MTLLLGLLCAILLGVVAVQIARVSDLAKRIRGEEEAELRNTAANGRGMLIFMVIFLIGCIVSAAYYNNWMLGFGPLEAASVHGNEIDSIFKVTLFFTGIIFILTQIALFYFAWKYQYRSDRKVLFMPHDTKLEVIWTVVPAVVMCFLVIRGLVAWNEVMADIPLEAQAGEDYLEIEATGWQFAWTIRYPGPDNLLGTKDFRLVDPATNVIGQDWTDEKGLDDFYPQKIVLPVGKTVRVRITSRDVLHNFYLPHFRVKMDAVPGMPTYFVFTPKYTTEEYRRKLGAVDDNGEPLYPEYWELTDPDDPDSGERWRNFNFELACAELCGRGHYSMQKYVEIVTEEEYEEWAGKQASYFLQSVRGTENDPYKDQLLGVEIEERRAEFTNAFETALGAEADTDKTVTLNNVNFDSGRDQLTDNSVYELDNLVSVLNRYPDVRLEIGGHTDNTGNADGNLALSQSRADAVGAYLTSKGISNDRFVTRGYGPTKPVESNDTEEGRLANRRTEFSIIEQ